ncbi:MAG TPA: DoxX family protein [Opitutaceae bacterium]|nr:DoxX family protein [Opitutaceae bacterium]
MKKLDHLLAAVGGSLQSVLLLVIRLYWGWQFAQFGWGKLTHLNKTAAYFATLPHVGMAPKLNAALAGSVESIGGILLLLGLFSRWASAALIVTMLMAYWTAENAALHSFFSNPDKFFAAEPFLFLAAALLVFVFGPGKVSLDALRQNKSASS